MRTLALLSLLLLTLPSALAADDAARARLREALTFHASFDASLDASFALGDPRIHTAPGGRFHEGRPGVTREDVSVDTSDGRHGGSLRIGADSNDWLFFCGDRNVAYREKDWSLTVSMWMRVDPERGLPKGYVDPLQITDKKWNDASIFLDWDQEPRDFRLGTFADDGVWNADGRVFDALARDERPMVRLPAEEAPFAADVWTHVVLTLEGFNAEDASKSSAKLHIDGQLVGSLDGRAQRFTWDPARVAMLLGIRYVGWIDELALFDRALSGDEIRELRSLRTGIASLFGEEGALRVRIVDATTGKPTTAMACLRSLDDDRVRLPPRGVVSRQPSSTAAFYQGQDDSRGLAGRVGPVRKMAGKGDNDDRSYVYDLTPSVPYWREPVAYQVAASFVTPLPAGSHRLSISHGMEFVPVERDVVIESGRVSDLEIRLERWAHLAAEGWYSGDVHVHHPALTERHREFLLGYAEAEDLNLVNVLEMGHHRGTDFRQEGFGAAFRRQRGNHALAAGQEEPRSTFGHIIGLNTRSLVRDLSTYDLYDLAFQGIHAQPGALVGYAHFSWNGCDLPRGFPWYVTTGEVDFVELMQFARVNADEYRDLLDLGFRIAAAAGSDVPWGSTIGECRTYVHTGGDALDVDAWFAGLAKGRSFVSNGPVLELLVNDERPGAVLALEKGATVRVSAISRGQARVGLPSELLVRSVGGGVARTLAPGGKEELRLDIETQLEESAWFTAEVRCENGALAHTSPVYVEIAGQTPRSRERGPEIIERLLASIATIEREFAGRDDARSVAIQERLEKAKAYWKRLREELDG